MASDGAALGYRARGTLPIRVEFARQLRRRRTKNAFIGLALLPLLLVLAFSVGATDPATTDSLISLVDVATNGSLNFTLFVVFATTGFFLVVVFALFFGDTVASEASWGSLRYLLAAPVPRARLLRQKAIVALLLSLGGLVILTAVALAAGAIFYGWDSVRTPVGITLTPGTALVRLLAIVAYVAFTLITVGALALMLSVLTDAPLAAVGGAVFTVIICSILDSIDALGSVRDYLPTHDQFAWVGMLATPTDSGDMLHGVIVTVVYSTMFLSVAFWQFGRKDIVS